MYQIASWFSHLIFISNYTGSTDRLWWYLQLVLKTDITSINRRLSFNLVESIKEIS